MTEMNSRSNTPRARVSPREFIQVWQTSETVAEVAQKLRTRKGTVRVRAFRYRALGVPLKYYPPVEVELPDWDALADYAAEFLPPDEGTDEPIAASET